MFKCYFLAVTYVITFLIIGVCLRKLVIDGDFMISCIYSETLCNILLKYHSGSDHFLFS